MKKYIILSGISASGKSTYTQNLILNNSTDSVLEINRDFVRFNIVSPGSNWGTYKMNKSNEAKVTQICLHNFKKGLEDNIPVIVDSNTNLNYKYQSENIKLARDAGYQIEFKDFDITFEEAVKRDSLRPNGVGYSVIYTQYLRYIQNTRKVYIPNLSLPSAIIVDIDGTVADKGDRSPFDWMKVDQDTPRHIVITMVKAVAEKYSAQILFTSGRDSVCRQKTLTWISKYFEMKESEIKLYMRPEGSMEKDTIVKEKILWQDLSPNYNIIAAFDDRPCIVRLWNSLKIPNVIAVADPYLEF